MQLEKHTNMHRLPHKLYVGNLQVFLIIQDSDLLGVVSLYSCFHVIFSKYSVFKNTKIRTIQSFTFWLVDVQSNPLEP